MGSIFSWSAITSRSSFIHPGKDISLRLVTVNKYIDDLHSIVMISQLGSDMTRAVIDSSI